MITRYKVVNTQHQSEKVLHQLPDTFWRIEISWIAGQGESE
ncbi:MAG: hypothetical protein VX694_16015 [Planctomycetota bacterium]|nr:hypothetical protein [Planctomycetota bacterium]